MTASTLPSARTISQYFAPTVARRDFLESDETARAALPESPVESCSQCADDSDDRENA